MTRNSHKANSYINSKSKFSNLASSQRFEVDDYPLNEKSTTSNLHKDSIKMLKT